MPFLVLATRLERSVLTKARLFSSTTIKLDKKLSSADETDVVRGEDLIKSISDQYELSMAQSKRIYDTIFDGIVDALSKKKEVKLSGFGAFQVATTPERNYRNLQTGELEKSTARERVKFTAFKMLKDTVNGGEKK